MTQWKKRRINIDDLLLDQRNMRLPLFPDSQEDLIRILVERENAFEIVESILNYGYYQHVDLIVVKEDNKYVVMDGNRRAASCKIISLLPCVPTDVKDKLLQKFKAKVDSFDTNSINEVHVTIAPSRREAYPYLHMIHTTENLSRKWNFASVLNCIEKMGKTEIKEFYGFGNQELNRYLILSELHKIIKKSTIDVNTVPANDIMDFDFETLEAIHNSKPGLEFLGVKLKGGTIKRKDNVLEHYYERAVRKIAFDIYDRSMKVTKNHTRKIKNYLERIEEYKPYKILPDNPLPPTNSPVPSVDLPMPVPVDSSPVLPPVEDQRAPLFDPPVPVKQPVPPVKQPVPPVKQPVPPVKQPVPSPKIVINWMYRKEKDCKYYFAVIQASINASKIEPGLKEIALIDLEESFLCYISGAHKSAIVMLGAVLEGIMLGVFIDFISKNQDYSKDKIEEIASAQKFDKLVDFISKKFTNIERSHLITIQNLRNTIHPWKTKRKEVDSKNSYGRLENSLTSLYLVCEKILAYCK